MNKHKILKPGRNCWKIEKADKVSFLIDAEVYFNTLYHSLQMAREQVIILSWDIYSQLKLVPEKMGTDLPSPRLGKLLDELAKRCKKLRIHILNWDYSLLMAPSREWLPIYKFNWKSHRRVQCCLDNQYPLGASHHQKVVVIDNALAFSGGLDLTKGRWDSQQHLADDPRRQIADGVTTPSRPYHDVQMAVSGPVAGALGDLARDRWQRGTGKTLSKPDLSNQDYWLKYLPVELENVDVAIARTQPAFAGSDSDEKSGNNGEIREVEQLYLDSIQHARHYIYIENQFFTSPSVCAALEERLTKKEGPEIILNLPLETEGWLSQNSLDVIRVSLINRLRSADKYNRFAVYYPALPKSEPMSINLHAKLMIMDNSFVRVGSANLNNRSMGLDTECDLAIEANEEHPNAQLAIQNFRNRLLAEHLDSDPETVQAAIDKQGTVITGIESLRTNARTLAPLEPELTTPGEGDLHDIQLSDPERPLDSDGVMRHFISHQEMKPAKYRIGGWIASLAIIVGLAISWRFTPLGDLLNVNNLVDFVSQWRDSGFAPLFFILAFIIGGILVVPVTLMIIISVLVFGPVPGFFYALIASVISSLAGYGLGSLLGRNAVRQLAGKRLNQVSKKLAKRGMLTIIAVRIIPVAPFTVVNIVAGASHIRIRDFFMGTVLGLLPGIIGITLLTDRVEASLRSPDWQTILTMVLVAIVLFAAGFVLSRHLHSNAEA